MGEDVQMLTVQFGVNNAGLQAGMATARTTLVSAARVMVAELQRVTRAITEMGSAAVSAFKSEETALAELNTILRFTGGELDRLGDALGRVAVRFGIDKVEALKASYAAASAGFTDFDENLDIVVASLTAARAGLGDSASAVEAVTKTLFNFKKQGVTAAEVADLLFKTVEKGQLKFQEISDNIGKFSGVAAQANLTLAETLTAFSGLSKSLDNADQSATALKNILVAFLKPGTDLEEVIAGIGQASGQAAIENLGFAQALKAVIEEGERTGKTITDLFPNIRALVGTLSLAEMDDFVDVLKEMEDASDGAGAATDALAVIMDTTAFKLAQAESRANQAAATFGESLAPAYIFAAKAQALFLETASKLPSVVLAVGGVTALAGSKMLEVGSQIGFMAFGVSQLGAAFKDMNKQGGGATDVLGKFGGISRIGLVGGIILLVAILVALWVWVMKTIGAFDMWAAQARALMRMMKALVSGVGRIVSAFFKLGVTLLDIGFLLLGLGNEWEAFKTTVVDVVDTIGDKFNWLKDKIQNWGDAVQENIDQVNREADMFIEWVDNIANAVEQLDGFIDKLEELRDFLKGGGLRELGEDFLSIGGDEGISAPGGPLGGLTGSGLGQLTGSSTGTGGVVQNITNNISGAVGGQPNERAAIIDDLRDMLRTEANRFGIPRKFGTP